MSGWCFNAGKRTKLLKIFVLSRIFPDDIKNGGKAFSPRYSPSHSTYVISNLQDLNFRLSLCKSSLLPQRNPIIFLTWTSPFHRRNCIKNSYMHQDLLNFLKKKLWQSSIYLGVSGQFYGKLPPKLVQIRIERREFNASSIRNSKSKAINSGNKYRAKRFVNFNLWSVRLFAPFGLILRLIWALAKQRCRCEYFISSSRCPFAHLISSD